LPKFFIKKQVKEAFLFDTEVENLFISEYMITAPGDFVKVYLFALMYTNLEQNITNETISKQLELPIEEVLKAWTYWEGLGIVKKYYINPDDKFSYQIELLNLKELVYGKNTKRKRSNSPTTEGAKVLLEDKAIKDMYTTIEKVTGRMLGGKEPVEIMTWISEYGATPEMVVYAYSYCVKIRKKDNSKYIGAVVKEWAMNGLLDIKKIETYLEETDNRYYLYKRILKSLGFIRNATEEEQRLIDTWFDEMKFSIDKILEACGKTSGIPNPNMNYVNKILRNWYEGNNKPVEGERSKGSGAPSIFKYYDKIREEAEKQAVERKNTVYREYPRVKEIDEELRNCGMKISRIMVSGADNSKDQIKTLKNKADKLSEEKAYLLTANNMKIDYLDVEYRCPACRDTGINDIGERCSCFKRRLDEAEEWQKQLKESKAELN
jgi:DnaD/phage-associated family protein